MERGKKEQLTARNPKTAWETIREMILDDEGMTIDELDEELREYGIEPDESIRRLFELALKISRKPDASGRVSPHVSEILSQLAAKYYRLEAKATAAHAGPHGQNPTQEDCEAPIEGKPKARAAVLSYYRNHKGESLKDQAIRKNNERRLQDKVEKLRRKKTKPER